MIFWILASLIALGVAGLLALTLLRTRSAAAPEPAAAYDLRVYRDQLKEIDRDLARGTIAAADAERVRTEVARRILAADTRIRAAAGTAASRGPARIAALLLIAAVAGGSLLLYGRIGAPGYGDLGLERRLQIAETLRASRPGQAMAEAGIPAATPPALSPDYAALIEQLRATVAQRPDDLQGQALLARHEAASGNAKAAYQAQARVLELKGEAATGADYAAYADMMILAAGGYVSPEAEAALSDALARDSRNGVARYYWGLMLAQTGRPDRAFNIWNRLMVESTPESPWNAPVRAQIVEVARRAGIAFDLPPEPAPGPRGPSAEDIAAAATLGTEERQAMIRSMVEGLAGRLADEGGPPADWARLISSLGVLGELEQARAIYAEARASFAGNDAALAEIAAAAASAGVLQ